MTPLEGKRENSFFRWWEGRVGCEPEGYDALHGGDHGVVATRRLRSDGHRDKLLDIGEGRRMIIHISEDIVGLVGFFW